MDVMQVFMDEIGKISGLSIMQGFGNRPAQRIITRPGPEGTIMPAGRPRGPSSPPDPHQQAAARFRAMSGYSGPVARSMFS